MLGVPGDFEELFNRNAPILLVRVYRHLWNRPPSDQVDRVFRWLDNRRGRGRGAVRALFEKGADCGGLLQWLLLHRSLLLLHCTQYIRQL